RNLSRVRRRRTHTSAASKDPTASLSIKSSQVFLQTGSYFRASDSAQRLVPSASTTAGSGRTPSDRHLLDGACSAGAAGGHTRRDETSVANRLAIIDVLKADAFHEGTHVLETVAAALIAGGQQGRIFRLRDRRRTPASVIRVAAVNGHPAARQQALARFVQ